MEFLCRQTADSVSFIRSSLRLTLTVLEALIMGFVSPQVTIVSRSAEDDMLLLASDGLWDVLSNQVLWRPFRLSHSMCDSFYMRPSANEGMSALEALVISHIVADRYPYDKLLSGHALSCAELLALLLRYRKHVHWHSVVYDARSSVAPAARQPRASPPLF